MACLVKDCKLLAKGVASTSCGVEKKDSNVFHGNDGFYTLLGFTKFYTTNYNLLLNFIAYLLKQGGEPLKILALTICVPCYNKITLESLESIDEKFLNYM